MIRKLRDHARGIVMLEMLLCLMPVLLMFMATTQAAFFSVAHLVVRHAAQRGARTAIVVLEDSPANYDDEPCGHIASTPPPAQRATQELPTVSQVGTQFSDMIQTLVDREPTRLNAIRAAVYLPMALIGPALGRSAAVANSLGAAIDHGSLSFLTGGLLYNLVATAVTFPLGPASKARHTGDYGPTDQVTVRVTHLFQCEVPFAALFMCDTLLDLETGLPLTDAADAVGSAFRGDVDGAIAEVQRAQQVRERLTAQEAAMADLQDVELPLVQKLMALRGGRFVTIVGEATQQIHGATYYPRKP